MNYTYEAIPAAELAAIRAAGRDEAGNELAARADDEGGSPLRCCLHTTKPGERVLLIAYTPPGGAGAYAERGPVFVHAEPCEGYRTPHEYPPDLYDRPQTVRAYNEQGRIEDGVYVSTGTEADRAIADLLDRPGVTLVQLRNVGFGCYNFAVRKGTGG
jgi:hypothetical protein